MKRYHVLDDIRGITLISMVCYHAAWDWNYIFGAQWSWFYGPVGYWWQQSICWVFILLSGFCWSMGRHRIRRGLVILAGGSLISLVTEIFMPDQRVRFGVLTLLGVCALLWIPLDCLLVRGREKRALQSWERRRAAAIGFGIMLVCFAVTREINQGYLGFERLHLWQLPEALYHGGDPLTFLGFQDRDFVSADYFSLLPWSFLYGAGYFAYHMVSEWDQLKKLTQTSSSYENIAGVKLPVRVLRWLGRHSMVVYLLHQPLVYGILYLIKELPGGR